MRESGSFSLVNYHSHTWRCQHASGTEEEYILKAIDMGFDVLGFADHTPWPYASDYVSGMRMRLSQFPDYVRTLRALGEKYANRIFVPLGLECEAFPDYMGWLADLKAQYLDYLILGNHFERSDEHGGFYFGACKTPDHLRRYADCTIAGMESGLFAYLAHPDLFCRAYGQFDADCRAVSRDLCAAARQLNVPLEYNLLGLQYHARDCASGGMGYPYPKFWEIAAENGCQVILGLDAHNAQQLSRRDLFVEARQFLGELGLSLLEALPGLQRG